MALEGCKIVLSIDSPSPYEHVSGTSGFYGFGPGWFDMSGWSIGTFVSVATGPFTGANAAWVGDTYGLLAGNRPGDPWQSPDDSIGGFGAISLGVFYRDDASAWPLGPPAGSATLAGPSCPSSSRVVESTFYGSPANPDIDVRGASTELFAALSDVTVGPLRYEVGFPIPDGVVLGVTVRFEVFITVFLEIAGIPLVEPPPPTPPPPSGPTGWVIGSVAMIAP